MDFPFYVEVFLTTVRDCAESQSQPRESARTLRLVFDTAALQIV
jgi:hypothetical protein